MLNDIHDALKQLLYVRGRIDPREVDVRFEAPDEEWVNSLTRPTISFFLFDIQENTEKRETSLQTVRGNGTAQKRMPPRRLDLYYMASVLTADAGDEHQLLWRVLATLMKHQQLQPDVLPDSLKSLEPAIVTRLENKSDKPNLVEIWNALGSQPRPALCYVVTAPLDLDVTLEAPLVLTRTVRYRTDRITIQIGGVVRDDRGQPLEDITIKRITGGESSTTNKAGQYILRGVPEGTVTLSVLKRGGSEKQVDVNVPSHSYDIVLDN